MQSRPSSPHRVPLCPSWPEIGTLPRTNTTVGVVWMAVGLAAGMPKRILMPPTTYSIPPISTSYIKTVIPSFPVLPRPDWTESTPIIILRSNWTTNLVATPYLGTQHFPPMPRFHSTGLHLPRPRHLTRARPSVITSSITQTGPLALHLNYPSSPMTSWTIKIPSGDWCWLSAPCTPFRKKHAR